MGGPCKATGDRNKTFVQENVAGKAVNRGTRHPNASCLDYRIAGYERALKHEPKYDMHKPGSEKK